MGFFFFLFYFYSYKCSSPAAFPVLREAVPRVSQQGRCSPFAPLPPRSALDWFLGKSWSLSVLAQEVPGPVVSAQADSSFRHPRSGLACCLVQETAAATRLLEIRKRCPNLQLHPQVAFSRKTAGQLPWPPAKLALAVDGGGSCWAIHKLVSADRSKRVPVSRSAGISKDTPGFWSLTVSFDRFKRMQVPYCCCSAVRVNVFMWRALW